jgi:hypothetical protein
LKKKELSGTSETDPIWIINLCKDLDNANTKDSCELVKKLFNDYLSEGMPPREALEKAKKVAGSFKF